MDNFFDIAIIGSRSALGKAILSALRSSKSLKIKKLIMFDESAQEGCFELTNENIAKNRADIAIFCSNSDIARRFAPFFSALGCTAIDTSRAFRLDAGVPLVIPSINPDELLLSREIISCPDISTVIALSALYPINKKYPLKRIFFNIITPKTGKILSNGINVFEQDIIDETKKILGDKGLSIGAAATHMPVRNILVNINMRLSRPCNVHALTQILLESGIKHYNYPINNSDIYLKRIFSDFSSPDSFNLILTAKATEKTAFTAVQTASLLMQ